MGLELLTFDGAGIPTWPVSLLSICENVTRIVDSVLSALFISSLDRCLISTMTQVIPTGLQNDSKHATAGSFTCKADHSFGRTSSLLDPTLKKTYEANITEQLGIFEWHWI